MMPTKKYIPAFDATPIHLVPDRAKYPAAVPMEIEAIGDNEVRITIGASSRVVDGVSLSNAVHECIDNYRRGNR